MPLPGSRLVATALAVAAVAVALGACSSDGTDSTASSPAPTDAVATTVATPPGLQDQYNSRYCEVLGLKVGEATTTAEVWGTQGLNDCPPATFAAIDPATAAAELGVTAALPNGPRFWVLDSIVANRLAGSGEIRSFNGLEMRSIAVVDLGKGLPDRRPYVPLPVQRDTDFVYDAGREIHELTAPNGSVYVMQSYSIEVDPTLTPEGLRTLGSRLALPDGWTYTSRVLDDRLVLQDVDGIAAVLQDELRNSYQLVPPTAD
jgi:haloalkane dehalogenase